MESYLDWIESKINHYNKQQQNKYKERNRDSENFFNHPYDNEYDSIMIDDADDNADSSELDPDFGWSR